MENNPRCHIVRSCLLALTQIVGQNEGRVAAVCRVWCVKTLVSLAWCVHSTLLSGCQSRAIKIYRAQLSWRKLKSDLIPHTAAPLTCAITSLLLCVRAHLSIRGAESSRRRSNSDSFRTRRANVSYECSYRWAEAPISPLRALRLHLWSDRSDHIWSARYNSSQLHLENIC